MSTQYVLDDNTSQDGRVDVYQVPGTTPTRAAQQHRKICEYSKRVATYRCGSVYSDVLHLYGITDLADIDQVKRVLSPYYESSAIVLAR